MSCWRGWSYWWLYWGIYYGFLLLCCILGGHGQRWLIEKAINLIIILCCWLSFLDRLRFSW